jgi:hypothetical protein
MFSLGWCCKTSSGLLTIFSYMAGICQLCYTHPETALHIMVECPYAIAVWRGLQEWHGFSFWDPPNSPYRTFKTWWHNMLNPQAPDAKDRAQKIIYTVWNVWKE